MITPKETWIQKGYEIYALNGLESLKVEQLAKAVEVSKSSFYHYFADLECFLENLFDHHFKRFSVLSKKEANCKSIHPELLDVLIEHKIDLLFHRQLRINRNDKGTEAALLRSSQILGNYGVMLWAKDINLKLTTNQLKGLFEIATEDFYMQIHKDNFHRKFLSEYFENLTRISNRFV
ncbi:TetR/AcrR family transcriptional regulator [Maribacter algarum]|uniref:TetR/AcrR family transcriptional regulator n=1 Tax=Maribacter algarum (ex Zhang et al. 2020) TaxID=2578118 RepID=A0A5S3PH97_9FLAO|nr:TetR/AcrR family transcriptional regulator [Maribacter algarum]TMM53609.1 TetR/AcrR family transcriptional regulator [Maribacter algarum]